MCDFYFYSLIELINFEFLFICIGFIPAQSGVGNPSPLPIKHMMTKTGASIVANSSVNGIRNRNDTSSSSVRERSYEKVVIASNKRQTSNISEKPFYSSTVSFGRMK